MLEVSMTWFIWALLTPLLAGLPAVLAKAGVKDVDSSLTPALRTVLILICLGNCPFQGL